MTTTRTATLTPTAVRTILSLAGIPTRHTHVRHHPTRPGAVTVTIQASRHCHGPSQLTVVGRVITALDAVDLYVTQTSAPTTLLVTR